MCRADALIAFHLDTPQQQTVFSLFALSKSVRKQRRSPFCWASLAIMRRSTVCLAGFTMKYKKGTGLYDEDHVNDFNASPYMSARTTMRWYYHMERLQTRNTIVARRGTQSQNNNMGLHHSGQDAFEREAERRGLPVKKYNLTTTTGAARVSEMVLLRRAKLEEESAKLMEEQRGKLRQEAPSSWYDEKLGPLNPNFLGSMQANYTKNITKLPNTPIIHRDV